MTDFDAVLRQRLLRLDAACPEGAPFPITRRRPAASPPSRPLAIAAAAVLLIGLAAAVVAAGRAQDERAAEIATQARIRVETEQRANAALAPLFPADECVPLQEGDKRARQALDAAGLKTWQVLWDGDLLDGGCATYQLSLDNSPNAVELTPRSSSVTEGR
jgi:hypothetical protein